MGRGRRANQRLCSGPEGGSLAPGHSTPQNHYTVLRLGHDEDEGSVSTVQTGLQNEPKYSEKQSEFGTVNWTPYKTFDTYSLR